MAEGSQDQPQADSGQEGAAPQAHPGTPLDRSGGVDINTGGAALNIQGDVVGRDHVENIGTLVRRETRIFNIDIRLLPVVLVLVAAVGILAFLLLRPTGPQQMTGQFNVAVAEFSVVDPSGKSLSSSDGRTLADFQYESLKTNLAQLGVGSNNDVWPPERTGRIQGASREQRAQAAEALAGRIGAHVIIYGVITNTGAQSEVVPEFYVNYKGFEQSEDLAGEHELGRALPILLPFSPNQFQGVEDPPLPARVKALSLATLGLSYYATNNYDKALDYFRQAEAVKGWPKIAGNGKEVIYLLLGHATARLAAKANSIQHVDLTTGGAISRSLTLDEINQYLLTASNYYSTALALNPNYARARLGQASVLYMMALGDPSNPSFDSVDRDKLDRAAATFEEALASGGAPPSADIVTRAHFNLGQIDLVRAQIEPGDWLERAESEFKAVIQDYEGGNKRVAEMAGHSHAYLARIAQARGDTPTALAQFKQATETEQVTPYYRAYYLTRMGELYAANGQKEQALDTYNQAIRVAESFGDEKSVEQYTQRLNQLQSGK